MCHIDKNGDGGSRFKTYQALKCFVFVAVKVFIAAVFIFVKIVYKVFGTRKKCTAFINYAINFIII